jgi:hypothetical protein
MGGILATRPDGGMATQERCKAPHPWFKSKVWPPTAFAYQLNWFDYGSLSTRPFSSCPRRQSSCLYGGSAPTLGGATSRSRARCDEAPLGTRLKRCYREKAARDGAAFLSRRPRQRSPGGAVSCSPPRRQRNLSHRQRQRPRTSAKS